MIVVVVVVCVVVKVIAIVVIIAIKLSLHHLIVVVVVAAVVIYVCCCYPRYVMIHNTHLTFIRLAPSERSYFTKLHGFGILHEDCHRDVACPRVAIAIKHDRPNPVSHVLVAAGEVRTHPVCAVGVSADRHCDRFKRRH